MPFVPKMTVRVWTPGQLADDVEKPKRDERSTGDPREERSNSIAQRDPKPGHNQAESRGKTGMSGRRQRGNNERL